MKINKDTAISTSRVLLVPYDRRHVLKYHSWMEDPAIREATASDRLTLDEEYENQESWRASPEKLTFIICLPAEGQEEGKGRNTASGIHAVVAGCADAPNRMVGDVNFFLYPWDGEIDGPEYEAERPQDGIYRGQDDAGRELCTGEVDVMIASTEHRGKGIGRAAVATLLQYVFRNAAAIMDEYAEFEHGENRDRAAHLDPILRLLSVKIKADNEASIALFESLGFRPRGDNVPNYFGEIEMGLDPREIPNKVAGYVPDGYAEIEYRRE